jgi:hypothetical protein
VEGQSIAVEWRWAEGKPERLPELATDLVRLNVDVIVAGGTPCLWQWCRESRHMPLRPQSRSLCQKVRRHFQYYGIRGNSRRLETVSR